MQPAFEGRSTPDRSGPADQDQERRLERVLDVLAVMEDRPARAHDHRPVPLHQRREGGPIPTRQEPLQELTVGEARRDPLGEEVVVHGALALARQRLGR